MATNAGWKQMIPYSYSVSLCAFSVSLCVPLFNLHKENRDV